MAFKAISLNQYIKLHLKSNPDTNKAELKKGLLAHIQDFKNGVKCNCGNDIWVIGSTFAGNSCFTCITGESYPTEDYELIDALPKTMDILPPPLAGGFFNDDGTPFNPDLYPLPNLCLSCKKKDDPSEEILCGLTRMDQAGEKEFKCFAYEKKFAE